LIGWKGRDMSVKQSDREFQQHDDISGSILSQKKRKRRRRKRKIVVRRI
jgi:hypothetical protein